MLNENVDKVNKFYNEQIESMTMQFHALTKHALKLVWFLSITYPLLTVCVHRD